MTKHIIGLLTGASALIAAGGALAEPAALRAKTGWSTDLTLYLFSPISTRGTSTVAGASAPIDMNLRDALEVLDFTLSGRMEAWNGDFALIAEANYLGISDEQTSTASGPVGAGVSASVDVTQKWLGLLAGYRVASGKMASGRVYSVDVQGGARYNSLKQQVSIRGPGPGRTFGGTETWWEPVVGVRAVWEMPNSWTGGFMADAGGFGAGGNDLAWSATLAFDYSFNDTTSLKLGWRYYSMDFSTTRADGTFAYDVRQNGPLFGVTFSF